MQKLPQLNPPAAAQERRKILQVSGLKKDYIVGEVTVQALRGVSFDIYEGEFVVVLGPSGSGKSTILNIVGGIDTPTAGEILYNGKNIADFNEKQLTGYRRNAVGFVFQFYNLIPNLTTKENIELAAQLSAGPLSTADLLKRIDMTERAGHFPSQLSGGQQQRVAIARAIAKNPDLLLCDEPTGALDAATGVQVLRVLRDFNRVYGKTVVIITHNAGIGEMSDRVFTVLDGKIAKITDHPFPVEPEEVSW